MRYSDSVTEFFDCYFLRKLQLGVYLRKINHEIVLSVTIPVEPHLEQTISLTVIVHVHQNMHGMEKDVSLFQTRGSAKRLRYCLFFFILFSFFIIF